MTKQVQIFARLTKVDEAKRQITGVIANELPDLAGEIFDYTSSKPNFVKWSGEIAKASGGKSVGNLRAQHGKIVAGRLSDITMDDLAKEISVVAEVVDDNEWEKVQKGCYTGFSIGGAYGRKWKDATLGKTRYTAKPTEVSIVDLACNPDATFEVMKADGTNELRKYAEKGTTDLMDAVHNLFVDYPMEKVLGAIKDAALQHAGSTTPTELQEDLGKSQTEPLEADMNEEELNKAISTAVGASEQKLTKSIEDAVAGAMAKFQNGMGDGVAAALTKALEPIALANTETKNELTKLTQRLDEQDAKLAEMGKQAAPPKVALRGMEKAAEIVANAMQETHIKPVTDNRGDVDGVATLIKAAHAGGGEPLLK